MNEYTEMDSVSHTQNSASEFVFDWLSKELNAESRVRIDSNYSPWSIKNLMFSPINYERLVSLLTVMILKLKVFI